MSKENESKKVKLNLKELTKVDKKAIQNELNKILSSVQIINQKLGRKKGDCCDVLCPDPFDSPIVTGNMQGASGGIDKEDYQRIRELEVIKTSAWLISASLT